MTEDCWDDYLGLPVGSDVDTDAAPDAATTGLDWEQWSEVAPDEPGAADLHGADATGTSDTGTDAVALAETELSDASTDIIHASTTDDVDTMHDWTSDGGVT